MKKYILILFLIAIPLQAQELFPTYYENGIESPWSMGIDYDIGFSKFLSFNLSVLGGISSQVNRASTFGDVYFGEARTGFRFYMNKPDEWKGVFIELTGRYGVFDIPLRAGDTTVIFERSTTLLLGMGIYLGYRWKRNLVSDMKNLPFHMALEPYFGYTLDTFFPLDGKTVPGSANRFSLGLKFVLGFYTYKYRPGTTVTNEETGEITRKSDMPPAPDSTTNTNDTTNTTATNVQSSTGQRQRTLAMRDPWEQYVF
ncbi:MAG: hypothetical protein ACRC9L_00630 [Brevinema sp.]